MGVFYAFPLQEQQLVGGNGGFRVADFRLGLEFKAFSGRIKVLDSGQVTVQSRARGDTLANRGEGFEATITPTDMRNDVLRHFKPNSRLLDEGIRSAAEGKLTP